MHLVVAALTEGEQNRLIQAHMDMVPRLASDYRGKRGIPFEDLCQEGMVGLVQAARNYRPGPQKFSSWAIQRIRGQIQNFINSWEEFEGLDIHHSVEKIFEWQLLSFMLRLAHEDWEHAPSAEDVRRAYEEISGKSEEIINAFMSLSRRERQMIEAHFLDKPNKSLDQIARDHKVSYRKTLRIVLGAIDKMRSVIDKLRENSGKIAA